MKKPVVSIIFVVAVVLVVTFQNCGGFMPPLAGHGDPQSIAASANRLLSSPSYVYRKTQENVVLDKNPVLSETASVILVFDRNLSGNLFRLAASDTLDEARITVLSGVIRIWHVSDANNYAYADVPLPENTSGEQVTVAASFGVGSSSMTLLVNGRKQTLTFQKVGSPFDFSYVQRTVALEGSGGTLLDVAVFSEALRGLDLNAMSLKMANDLQIYNVVFDSSLVNDTGPGGSSPDTPEFLAAKAVIDNNCLSCHNSSNYGDFRNLTQAQFISKGLVVAKDPANSKMYYRLSGALSGAGPATMPQGAAALSADQIATIATWINSIN